MACALPQCGIIGYNGPVKDRAEQLLKNDKWLYGVAGILFVMLSVWYLRIHSLDLAETELLRQAWGSMYQVLAILGCTVGFMASKKWDGRKSLIGKALMLFAIGLLLQSFGQSVNSYYNFFEHHAIPYPSLGDVGFMGSVFAYIAGATVLLKASGFQFTVKSFKARMIAVIVPLVVLIASYAFFLNGYVFDWSNTVKILLDFAYPLGQATYISIVLLAYLTSFNYDLGVMKKPLLFLLIALAAQYAADFTFLYQANAGTWYVGGPNDFMYFTSYFLMALALLVMGGVRRILPEM